MNLVEFGFDRSRGFGSGRGQFWPIAIDRPTRPYNFASTTVQQVMMWMTMCIMMVMTMMMSFSIQNTALIPINLKKREFIRFRM
jgi:hypothetical protein